LKRIARTSFALLLTLVASASIRAQAPSQDARLQGYSHVDEVTTFVFDVAAHGLVAPERVVVTGAFRNWDQDMNHPGWQLRPDPNNPGVWVLPLDNPGYQTVPPGSPFKFRINEGRWLDPPSTAPNQEGGNLVFLFGMAPPRLQAELRGPTAVWATLTGDGATRPLDPAAYRLTDGQGREVPIARVLPNTASETLIVPAYALDVRRVFYLEVPGQNLRALCRRDPWFRTLYSDKELGAIISEDGSTTTFRLFAPRADRVVLYFYFNEEDTPEEAAKTIEMTRDADGVWETTQAGDHHGIYYDFTIHGPQDPGNFFFETHPVHISDPYARVSVDSFGKSRVWRPTTPAGPVRGGRPAMEEVIAYEVHIQDFTDLLPVDDKEKGTIPAMVKPGLTNSVGEPIGFDYLVNLGINVVHLMPVQEFLHFPDAVWQASFKNDPYMTAQGINLENYQWGYRTTHAFAVETRYRKRGTEHGAQREQLRDLVQAFHDKGIAVIIDLVPNHTGENMDGRNDLFTFNVLDKPYYYRTDQDLAPIGPFGNEVKTEDRPMVQRWLIDQCRHFIEEFGIDGFRVDLAGQIDEQSLLLLRRELGDDIILYGEPWIPPSDPDVVKNPDWAWYKADAPLTFFQDDARNAFKGPVSNPENKLTDRGYPGGDASQRGKVMQGLLNSFPDEVHPNRGINYLDIHDNWALADQFATNDWDGRFGVDEGPFKLAAGLLFTSLGPVVLHGGTEIMRSKGLAPLEEIVKTMDGGEIYLHGKRDTYNLRRANQFMWEHVGQTRADEGSNNDYANMLAYWKGLIAFRKSDAGAVFRVGEAPPDGYYRWILPDDHALLGYLVDERVLVLINTDEEARTFEAVTLPAGSWRLIADGDRVDHLNGVEGIDGRITGAQPATLSLPAASLKIWVRE